ncbi:MAG: hypothetical protein KF789_00405 [Bdellovibrionaceae bacterium]|nr:hypothetical protein [Pseudobdellovibrionaceae bacterium]
MRLLLSLLLILPLSSLAQTTCQPTADSCEMYLCKEREISCGAKGYWLNYGFPFCQRFLEKEQEFSPVAQGWLRKVRTCLQTQVQELSPGAACSNIRQQALHGHIDCYLQTGFCDLNNRDQIQVLWELKSALGELQTWQESYLLAQACSTRAPQP